MNKLNTPSKAVALLGAWCVAAATAQAAPLLLWDNGSALNTDAWNFTNTVRDDFVLSGARTVTSVEAYVYSLLTPNFASDLLLRIDSVELGIAGLAATPAGILSANNATVYLLAFDVVDTTVAAGTHMLQIGTQSPNGLYGWAWTTGLQLSPSTLNGSVVSTLPPTDVAFRLYGTELPEPGSLALVLLALAGLRVLGRRGAA